MQRPRIRPHEASSGVGVLRPSRAGSELRPNPSSARASSGDFVSLPWRLGTAISGAREHTGQAWLIVCRLLACALPPEFFPLAPPKLRGCQETSCSQ